MRYSQFARADGRANMIAYALYTISNAEMDELVKREHPLFRVVGYPLYQSPDGRIYPLPVDGVTIGYDCFVFNEPTT